MLCKDFYQNIQLRNRGAHTCHCTVTIETPTGTGINTRLIISGLQDKNRRQQQYIQNIHHRRRFVLAVLTYCYAPAHSCSRAIPCEDRALTIRGFPAQHRAERDVKVFWRTDSVRQAGTVKQVPFCGFKMQFPHIRNISPERKICVFRGFCVRKNNQRENRNISHRINRIHRTLSIQKNK